MASPRAFGYAALHGFYGMSQSSERWGWLSLGQMLVTLSTLIEPVMIVVMGAIAGGVIFALYLPIFSLGQAIKGSLR